MDHYLNSPENVYPNNRWVPCTSNLVFHGSSGSPEKDGIENLPKFFHPSKRRKYRSYSSVASIKDLIEDLVLGAEMSPYPPLPLPKSKKQIKEERIEERMSRLAQKIRNYHAERYNIPNATQNPNNTLFVARLSYESTTEAIVNKFRLFGQILEVKLVTNREGRSRGYAFIEFINQESLKTTLTSSKKIVIDGREVLLDYERRRLEIGWLPRRLGGGLGVKPKRRKKKKKKKKKENAEAPEASVTSTPNTEASSQNNQKQAAVNVSKKLETMSIVEEGSQTKITAKNVKKKKNSAGQVSVEPSESSVKSSGSSTNPSADFSGQAASTFDHQSSIALPQYYEYVEEIPAASYVQYQQPDQYSLPQPNQICQPVFVSSQPQQSASYNSYIVQENSYSSPVNYIPPVSGIIYPQAIPAHQFDPQLEQNFGAQAQNYQVQPSNHFAHQVDPQLGQNVGAQAQNYQVQPSNHFAHQVDPQLGQNFGAQAQNYQVQPSNHFAHQVDPQLGRNFGAQAQNYQVQPSNHFAHQVDPQLGQNFGAQAQNYQVQPPNHFAHEIDPQLGQNYGAQAQNYQVQPPNHFAHETDPQLGQNYGAQAQNYQVQPPNHVVLQPANHNISYLAPNLQPTCQVPSLPPQNYQAPPVFYPVQQPVVQNSSQFYQNYSGEPGNYHVQQFNHSIP